jgi:hypothetical protein
MDRNARVVWATVEKPWETEKSLLGSLSLPLNLRDNKHPFVPILRLVRQEATARARMLPIVEDNVGARRLLRLL